MTLESYACYSNIIDDIPRWTERSQIDLDSILNIRAYSQDRALIVEQSLQAARATVGVMCILLYPPHVHRYLMHTYIYICEVGTSE